MKESKRLVELDGVHGQFVSFENDKITTQIRQYGAHTRNEIALLIAQLKPGYVCVDIGAHIGTFTVPIAKRIGNSGRLLSIEGSPRTTQLLARNVKLNNLADNVKLMEAIVGDGVPRPLVRHERVGNSGAGHYVPDDDATLVPTIDCAALLKSEGFDQPDLIKIDVEGMEAIILRNISSILTNSLPILYVEISTVQLSRFGDSAQEIENQLRSIGYRFYRNRGPRNSSSDVYDLEEIQSPEQNRRWFGGEKTFFDLLAMPPGRELSTAG